MPVIAACTVETKNYRLEEGKTDAIRETGINGVTSCCVSCNACVHTRWTTISEKPGATAKEEKNPYVCAINDFFLQRPFCVWARKYGWVTVLIRVRLEFSIETRIFLQEPSTWVGARFVWRGAGRLARRPAPVRAAIVAIP